MSRIDQYQCNWRIVLLVLMIVAFIGPWAFERISVPEKHTCSHPYIRLGGDFCGIPLPGIGIIFGTGSSFISIGVGLLTGEFVFIERVRDFLIIIWLVLFSVLPFISTLLLILRGNNQRGKVFSIIASVLAIGGGLYFGLMTSPKLFWLAWGIWLYIGLAISTLILEIIMILSIRSQKRKLLV